MKKIRHYKNLANLINRHSEYDLYHYSIGKKPAYQMNEYAEAHKKPVTIEWNDENKSWDIKEW